jgi:hypothetical protein
VAVYVNSDPVITGITYNSLQSRAAPCSARSELRGAASGVIPDDYPLAKRPRRVKSKTQPGSEAL